MPWDWDQPRPTADDSTPTRPVAPVPRVALNVGEACAALGVSWDFWREHIESEIRVVRRGRRKLIAVAELERWLEREAERTLPDA